MRQKDDRLHLHIQNSWFGEDQCLAQLDKPLSIKTVNRNWRTTWAISKNLVKITAVFGIIALVALCSMILIITGFRYSMAGFYYELKGDDARALQVYEEGLASLDNPDFNLLNNHGEVLLRQGRFAEALEDFDAAIEANPDDYKAYMNRGMLYLEVGLYGLAVQDEELFVKAIITGMNGAVGSALKTQLLADHHTVVGWNRTAVPVDDPATMEQFLQATQPNVLFHLAIASHPTGKENEGWLVNVEWPTQLTRLCLQNNIRFVFTSSVMVFTDDAVGPFTPESEPDAREGYGFDKLTAEQQVRSANPEAIVARLGWQIGEAPGSNNMIDFLAKQEVVRASERWFPACSFLVDTAVALQTLATADSGLYLLDSNDRWNFYQITTALNQLHGNSWRIEKTADFIYDQRMRDSRSNMPPLDKRLPSLA